MLKRDMIAVQEAAPKSIRKQRIAGVRNNAKLKTIAANVAVAEDSRVSVENFDLVRSSTMAPNTEPNPKDPSKNP
jgi:hypothetical protein